MGIIRKCREIDAIRYGIAFRVTICKQAVPLVGTKGKGRLKGQKNRTQKNESITVRSRNRRKVALEMGFATCVRSELFDRELFCVLVVVNLELICIPPGFPFLASLEGMIRVAS